MSVINSETRARPGRPRRFAPDAALKAAMTLFWQHGYNGADLDSVAARVGVTKPALYRLFGDKEGLFLAAMRHYCATHGSEPVRAFVGEPTIDRSVAAFLQAALNGATDPACPTGCFLACVAAECAEDHPKVRTLYAEGLKATAAVLETGFSDAIQAGAIPAAIPASARAVLLIDFMQAIALRARSGASRSELQPLLAFYADRVLS